MSTSTRRLLGVTISAVAVCVLVGLYIGLYLTSSPGSARRPRRQTRRRYAAVSRDGRGRRGAPTRTRAGSRTTSSTQTIDNWHHATTFVLPANTLVHVTIYQFDGQSGLRNPFISQATGTVGGSFMLDGKPTQAIDPDAASHIFAIPQLGVSVPLYGIADDAKNPCANAPCPLSTDSPHDHVHVPHGGQGPVPLAVLRAVRGRLHRRLRRPDADGRLHGRLHQGRMRRRSR